MSSSIKICFERKKGQLSNKSKNEEERKKQQKLAWICCLTRMI